MPRHYSVTEVTRLVKTVLASSVPPLWVEGEVTNFRSRTYWYFGLKDEDSYLPCVCFAPPRDLELKDGMKVLAFGEVSVYEKRGAYQLYVARLVPVTDQGELYRRFEELKDRLKKEGVFDKVRRPLPPYPARVGLVTSPTGAARHDIASVFRRRFPGCQLILAPVRVQGGGAAAEIASAVENLGEFGAVDLIIVARGGGSLEDLWPFNEETVARAIARSRIPVVSAVGHETDFTCADFAADVRAPTPSAAAELVVPLAAEVKANLALRLASGRRSLRHRIALRREQLSNLVRRYAFLRPVDLVTQRRQFGDELLRQATRLLAERAERERQRIRHLNAQLVNLNPRNVLARGYAIARRLPQRAVVRASSELAVTDELAVEFSKGSVDCRVEVVHEE